MSEGKENKGTNDAWNEFKTNSGQLSTGVSEENK